MRFMCVEHMAGMETDELLRALAGAMMEDLRAVRERGDFRTAASYYRALHDNVQLQQRLSPLDTPTIMHVVHIILEEVDDATRERIIQRLAGLTAER